MLKIFAVLMFLMSNSLIAGAPIIIGIAGGTGSGKTTLAKKIQSSLAHDAVLIEQDCYYKDLSHLSTEERDCTNFDHPNAIDFVRLRQDIYNLKNGRHIEKPIYSFKTHTREAVSINVAPADVIIVEGILVFTNKDLNDLFDFKIFVETDDDVRILRRIERDILERGRDFESVRQQYLSTVKPMHNQFVGVSKQSADVIIPGESDTSAVVSLILAGLRKQLVE